MPPFVPVSRQRASDSVYDAIRQAILSRVLVPGQRLHVQELAAQLGVSPTPVKDALTRLEAEALVEIRPRSGTFVTSLSPEDVAETFEIRCALECLAAEKAIPHTTPDVIDELRALAHAIADLADEDAARQQHEARNIDFHKRIVSLSANRRLVQIYEGLDAHIQIARIHRGHDDWRRRLASELDEHLAIVEALAARDAGRVTAALRHHITRAAASLVRDLHAFEAYPAGDPPSPSPEREAP
ncbi:MAG: GntR family transcriptional regulator [Vicinamibacterales bacterium]|nr:GntR family transcriptional regulator [Vicinamibacterales bacterium]